MVSNISQKPIQNLEYSIENQVMSEIDSGAEKIRQELHRSIDLNHPIPNLTLIEPNSQSLVHTDTETVTFLFLLP